MVDDVLRMRATVVSDQALAELRKIGREIGIVGQRGAPGIKTINTEFARLGQTVRGVSRELTSAIPALGGLGLGAAGVGVAIGALARTMGDAAKRVVDLKYASKELGMSERDIRAWQSTAEKAGVSAQSMMQGLEAFKKTTDGLKYNIGGARDELYAMGAGPIVQRMQAAATQADKLKVAFNFKDELMKSDPTGFKARMFFDQMGLGADKARLSLEEYEQTQGKLRERTAEQVAALENYHKALVDLGDQWDDFKVKATGGLFPKLSQDLKDLEGILTLLNKLTDWMTTSNGTKTDDPLAWGADKLLNFNKQLPVSPNRNPRSGYKPTSFGDGFGAGGGLDEGSRMVKDGVFAALVEFQSYVQGAAGAGGGGGFTNASFGGSAGAAAGGGVGRAPGAAGFGGGGYSNLTPGSGGAQGGQSPTYDPGTGKVIGNTGGAGVGGGSAGGSGGITAPAGTPIARQGLATVTAASGRKFQVDQRFAQNFQGFINDYEKSGGDLGPDTGTLGTRPHNASGHPIGAAIDINQIGRGVRSRAGRGKSLSPEVEDALAAKWGMVSGNRWRSNDQGHFGIKTVEDARQALIRNGVEPGEASAIAKAQAGGKEEGGKTVKGSVFGSTDGFSDSSEPRGRKTASGVSNEIPGIALPGRSGLGKMHAVTTPDGRTFMLPQTDIGPHPRTGRGIDITSSAAAQMGYSRKTFPTDGNFSYRRVDEQIAGGQKVQGNVAVNITSNGTAATAKAKTDGSLWQETTVQNYKQMQPTSAPVGNIAQGP